MTQNLRGAGKQVAPNDPCPCGSGKKFKRCCIHQSAAMTTATKPSRPGISELMNLALAHHQAGRLQQAIQIYQQILRSDPEHADALHYAGLAAHQTGQPDKAIALMMRSIQRAPGNSYYFLNLGQVHEARLDPGELERAIACYRQAAALDPSMESAHAKLGNVLLKNGDAAGAATSFSQALRINPDSPESTNGLADALHKLGNMAQAVAYYRKATALNPGYATAHNNLATVLHQLGRFDEAIASYSTALAHRPDSAEMHSNLGATLRSSGKLHDAVESCQKAIDLQPDYASAHLNLANAYKDLGLLRNAVSSYQEAIRLAPSDHVAPSNLADTLVEQDKIEEAVESYQKAIALESVTGTAYSNLLYLYSFSCHLTPEKERAFAMGWEQRMMTDGQREAARAKASAKAGTFLAQSREGRKLRLGIVSAELGAHAVAVFLQPFLDELDRNRFNLTLFPTVGWSDARSQHFRVLADGYISLIGVPAEAAAQRIRAEQIDVLIDTTGHTSNCHLRIFAHRAAPVQCSYIGYWSTTGLTEMDWYITDEGYSAHCDTHFSEKLWKLPQMAHRYKGDTSLPESGWTPDAEGAVWLGSFNKYSKIRGETLRLWAKVMNALPNSKLLLEDRAEYEAETHERILTALTLQGIASERVEFLPRVPGFSFSQHMALYDRMDIALDTIPFNSGTTAFDALWMGVPLVALEGSRVCGRMASSVVKALGRPEWSAKSEEEYVSIVCALAKDVDGRKERRKSQRAAMMRSPLCDAKGLARSLEDAIESMYAQWRSAG